MLRCASLGVGCSAILRCASVPLHHLTRVLFCCFLFKFEQLKLPCDTPSARGTGALVGEIRRIMNNFIFPISALLFLLLVLDTTASPPTGQTKGKLNIVESSSYYDRIEGNGYFSNRIVSTFSADLNFPNGDDAEKRIKEVITEKNYKA